MPQATAPHKERRWACACVLLILVMALFAACRSNPVSEGPISTLPDLTLPDVRGGAFHLRSQPAQPLLLAFLQTVPDTSDTPSRSQVVILASMAKQYGPRGLRVVAVDATTMVLGLPPARGASGDRSSPPEWSNDSVRNTSYDWQLRFPLLIDRDGNLARKLEVDQVPTTFLISAQGRILHRWRGFTRPAVLAQAIEELLGGPLAKTP